MRGLHRQEREGHAGAAQWLEAARLRIDCGPSQHMRKHIAVIRADRLSSATLFGQLAKRLGQS